MPTLIVENVPGEVYERLQKQADEKNRTLSEEVVQLLLQELGDRARDTGEMSAPFDLPRLGIGTRVPTRPGERRLPDPLVLPEPYETES